MILERKNGMMKFCFQVAAVALVLVLLSSGVLPSGAFAEDIPDALKPWRDWVLRGHEDALCPTEYNDGSRLRCHWPSRLSLALDSEGGRFEQRWLIFSRGWVALPGGRGVWPDAVIVDGRPAAVISRNDQPMVALEPGEHQISGRFFWHRQPELIHIPPSLGLLSLTIGGSPIRYPLIDGQGRLWLQRSEAAAGRQDRVLVTIFRLIKDSVPMQVHTVVRLDVSGKSRELLLDGIFLNSAVPMEVTSDLPVRIGNLGRLQVQARPGRWEIALKTRLPGPVHALSLDKASYGDQVWSFEARHDLRMVEVKGVPAVEPGQTEMPEQWRSLPAYQVKPGARMIFEEIRRGDPDPGPDRLRLHRRWWLDLDGTGFSVRDTIQGVLRRQWRLAVNRPLELGRVAVDGRDRVITRQAGDDRAGVEVRHGRLVLEADARLPQRQGEMPAVGWNHDFQQVSGVLHLPPGWKLLAATGVDRVSDAWLQRWSLLDFFIVLIIALAVLKLRGWAWSLVALATMVLIYHEPRAPRYVWLHLLAVLALLPVLPAGWFKRLLFFWGLAAAAVLLAVAVVFMVVQVRWGVYPQLSPPEPSVRHSGFERGGDIMPRVAESPALPRAADPKVTAKKIDMPSAQQRTQASWHQDPDAVIPTGPGLPDWQWRTLSLTWSGPVAQDQLLRFYLLSPRVNLLLALVRCVLLLGLIAGVLDWRQQWERLRKRLAPAAALLFCLAVVGQTGTVEAAQTCFPPPELLDGLRERLLEKPDCQPFCADISRMEITASQEALQLMLKVHAARSTAVPLPADRNAWHPDQVLLDNAPMSGLARDSAGRLWGLIPAGLHTLVLLGQIENQGVVRLPLPLSPHTVSFSGDGWQARGISEEGQAGASVELIRVQAENAAGDEGRPGGALPVFLHVERAFDLGLSWRVRTTVTRVTPLGTPVVIGVPLLDDETMTTAGFQVDNGQVLVNLPPDKKTAVYASTLPVRPTIRLVAPKAVPWTESWVLAAGPLWHCEFEGIAPVHHQDDEGRWQPQWRPWPGERVTVEVTRPKPVQGQQLTIDRADLVLTPGRRFGKGELALRIRSSRGGQHTIVLPEKANLQLITINGKSLPVRQEGRFITFPLQPGEQRVAVQWHQLAPFSAWFKTPEVRIGGKAVNVQLSLHMPAKRWILMTGGPRWGPAVLFWSYLVVLVLTALALGRMNVPPLKTWQWFLLALGLTQIPVPMALIIVGWIVVLSLRDHSRMPSHWLPFNTVQIGLAVWTAAALVCLFAAVKAGLAGQPQMQIAGNDSTHLLLNWTQDHSGETLPRAWVFSLPTWVFSLLMLIWSLWLALALLRWLKWGWQCFSKDGLWRKVVFKKARPADEA